MAAAIPEQPDATEAERAEYAAFYAEYYYPLLRSLLRRGAKPTDAEDIAQEAMLRTWVARHRFSDADHRRNYAFSCAATKYIDLQRLAETHALSRDDLDEVAGSEPDATAAAAVLSEQRQALGAALRELPPADRALLIDAEVHELDTGELVERYAISQGALRARRFRTRQALRIQLERLRTPALLLPLQRKFADALRSLGRWLDEHWTNFASFAQTAAVVVTAVSLVAGPFGGPLGPVPPAFAEALPLPSELSSRSARNHIPAMGPTGPPSAPGGRRGTTSPIELATPPPTPPTPSQTSLCVPGVGCTGDDEAPPSPGAKDVAYILVPGLAGERDRYLYVVPDAVEACDYWVETPVTGCTEGTPTPSPSPSRTP